MQMCFHNILQPYIDENQWRSWWTSHVDPYVLSANTTISNACKHLPQSLSGNELTCHKDKITVIGWACKDSVHGHRKICRDE